MIRQSGTDWEFAEIALHRHSEQFPEKLQSGADCEEKQFKKPE